MTLPTQKHIRDSVSRSGGDYYVYVAVWNSDGKPMASLSGPSCKAFAQTAASLILADPKIRIGGKPKRKKP